MKGRTMRFALLKYEGYTLAILGAMLSKGKVNYDTLIHAANGDIPKDLQDRSEKLAPKLAGADGGHNKFLEQLQYWLAIDAPLYFWKQAQRYHWFDFVSSQSTMHCLLKFDISSQCVKETNKEILAIMEKLIKQYNEMDDQDEKKKDKWRELIASLPCGFCLGATMTTNYQQLKTMYQQRKNHRLKEWHTFCEWIETLPYAEQLITFEP